MNKPLFDFTDKECAFKISDKMAMDAHGNPMMKMSDNMAIDMKTGKIHYTTSWNKNKKDNK